MSEMEIILSDLKKSKKYGALCEDTIRDIFLQEMQTHRTLKKATQPAKERLHKIWASYLGAPKFVPALKKLALAFEQGGHEAVKAECIAIMETHISTKERLGLIEADYYRAIFDVTGLPGRLADLACALNPFSFRWMGLPESVSYHAYDINKNFVDFINAYFQLEGLQPLSEWRDIYVNTPDLHFDVAFIFKMYHCLEHRKKGAGLELLNKVQADWVAVSFPSQNLIGKKADIYANYAPMIERTVEEMNWAMQKLAFHNEVLILIRK